MLIKILYIGKKKEFKVFLIFVYVNFNFFLLLKVVCEEFSILWFFKNYYLLMMIKRIKLYVVGIFVVL